ncbi:MAG: hypothetical protein JXQ29_15095 [Planctomycetes bacterium]|nr:hypothetical protein [Planctomycetota bacterium]
MGICTAPSVRFILLIVALSSAIAAQGAPVLYTPNPVDIPSDYHGREIVLWGERLDRAGLEVEWNGQRHPGALFELRHHPANELTLRIPSSIPLALGVQTLRLYDPTARAYTNPLKLIVSRATTHPAIPLEGSSHAVLDHFWGLWGGEEAVLQAGNLYAIVTLFHLPIAKNKTAAGARWGLPLMGFHVSSEAILTEPGGHEIVVPGDGKETAGGWTWEGSPAFPKVTNEWWAELYPPAHLEAGAYTVELKAYRDGKRSNPRSLIVLPPDTPPFLMALGRGAVVEGYTSALPAIPVMGYNLNRATHVHLAGPRTAAVELQVTASEQGSFRLPAELPPGQYTVHLGNATSRRSNRRTLRILANRVVPAGPEGTTFVRLDFRDHMFVAGGRADRWVLPGALRFVASAAGRTVPFFWRENLDHVSYDGQRADNHALLHPDRGTIEIRGYRPYDWPLGRTDGAAMFNHGYHHLLSLFPQGGDWRSKVRILVRTVYYFPNLPSPSWGYWDVWSHWNEQLVAPAGNWTHFEVVLRDNYEKTDMAVVVTDPSFAAELAHPIGTKTFDIKFVYDFVDRKEGALYIRVHGKDADYVDRTYRSSRKIATAQDRLDLHPLVNGAFDLGTEKRHPHRILEPSQPAKSGAGGTLDELVITDRGFDATARPEITFVPARGTYGLLQQFAIQVMVEGARSRLDFQNCDVGYLYVGGATQGYHPLFLSGIWEVRLVEEGTRQGYRFTLRTPTPVPEGRYVVSVSGIRCVEAWSPQAVADFRVGFAAF